MLTVLTNENAGVCRTWLRRFLPLSLTISALSLFVLVPGCPSAGDGGDDGDGTVDPCAGVNCDDENLCTTDSCDAGECTNAPVECEDGQSCDADTGECADDIDLCADVDCSDDDNCTDDVCDPADGTCSNPAVECADGEECDADTGDCVVVAPPASGLEDANTNVDFANLEVGDTIEITAPDPTAGAASVRQLEGCTCAWTVDPESAGSFDDAAACTTNFTVEEAGGFNLSVVVTCADADPITFNQDATSTEPPPAECTTDGDCSTDACDPQTCDIDTDGVGTCVAGDDACTSGDTCAVGTDGLPVCTPPVAASCTTDGDCDDGDFCNGSETCGNIGTDGNGTCDAGTNPCGAGEVCNEDTDACDCSDTPLNFILTTGTDSGADFTGGCGDDTYDGALFLTGGGTFVRTINNADRLDGGLGDDSLAVQINTNGTTTPAGLFSLEVIGVEITTNTPHTLNLLNATGTTTVNNNNSGASLTFSNVQSTLSNVGMTNGQQDLTVTLVNTALTTTSDTCTFTFSGISTDGAGNPDITIQPTTAASGYERFNFVSGGGIENVFSSFGQGVGNSWNTLGITGAQKVTIGTVLDVQVTTVDGTGGTGGFVLNFPNNAMDATGTDGDDIFNFSGGTWFNSSDSVAGADGDADELRLDDADADVTETQNNVSGIEILHVNTTAGTGNAIDATFFGATTLKVNQVTAATTFTIPDGGTFEMNNSANSTNNITVAPKVDGLTSSMTFIAGDSTGNNIVLTAWESVALETKSEAITVGGTFALATAAGSQDLTISGTQSLTFTGQVTADVVNATNFAQALNLNAGTTAAVILTGGSVGDVLWGSTSADQINGGDGSDTLRGLAGGDNLLGGNDADTYQYNATNAGGAGNAGTITGADVFGDFTPGVSNDVLAFNGTAFDPTGANAATINFQTITSATNGTAAVGLADPNLNTELAVVVNTTTLDNFAALNTLCDTTINAVFTNAANDRVVVIVNVTGLGQVIVHDPDLGTANDLLILGSFIPTIDLSALVAGNFDEFVN